MRTSSSLHPRRPPRLELARGREVVRGGRAMAAHSSSTPSPVAAVVASTGGRQPVGRGEVEHALEVAAGLVGAGAVGLVDHEHVGDLEQAGLVGLHGVAPAGVHHHDGGVGGAGHLHLDLADADGLDQHPRPAGGVEDADGLEGGERQPAEVAARGHRADEHAVVGGVVGHAHPIAEDGSAGEGRRRVDGEHGDRRRRRPGPRGGARW